MTVQIANHVGPAKVDIAYERFGDPEAPPVLLIMGLGAQLIAWPDAFCAALVEQGLQVIRFDNRDAGQSTHFSGAPIPNLPAAIAGDFSSATYTLSDMAADAVGLLDVLDIESAHLVGASMGGFIAQTIAIEHSRRVRSLTSIMSSTGDRTVGQLKPEGLALFAMPPVNNRQDAIDRAMAAARLIGSPGFPRDEAAIAERAGRSYDRGFDALGMARQGVAVVASGDRTARLRELAVPTLVMHGAEDKVCDVSGGRATAAAIPGAKLVVFDGMGHDLPRGLWPQMLSEIVEHVRRAEAEYRL
jgi:pimeloyl-ACP methyl ester carboxylesterase